MFSLRVRFKGRREHRRLNLLRIRKQIEASFSTLMRLLTLQAAQAKTFAHPYPGPANPSLSPYPQGGTPALSLTLNAGEPQDCFNLLHSGVLFR